MKAKVVKFFCDKTLHLTLSVFINYKSDRGKNKSDGPHRSLPMRRPWKKVAECADNSAFEVEEIRDAILPALENDCQREMRREFLDEFHGVCADQDASLFKCDLRPALERLRRTASAGLEHLVIDHAIHAAANGASGRGVAEKAVGQALKDRGASGIRQVEEHYLRESTAKRAHNVRDRMEQAISGANIDTVARSLLDGRQKSTARKPSRRRGLDDGVKL